MTGFTLAWAALYHVAAAVLLIGARRLRRSTPAADADCPPVTVVVSARNEAVVLPRTIPALLALDYPADRLRFVLVNDRSTDGTGALLESLTAHDRRVTVLHTEQLPDNGLEAKARGIAHGMAHEAGPHADNAWFLITDADAAVPASWVRHLMGEVTRGTTLVGGAGRVRRDGEVVPWWAAWEDVLWRFLQVVNVGAAGWRVPVVTIGPNMGIRCDAYRSAGGLERASFRIAEDLALYRMGRDGGTHRGGVNAYADPETAVVLDPVPSPRHIASQLRRWVGGGLEQGAAYRIGLPVALAWGLGVAVVLAAGWWWMPVPWALLLATKLLIDTLLLQQMARQTGGSSAWTTAVMDAVRLTLLHLWAMSWLPLSFLITRTVQWRGDGYTVRYR